MKIRDLISHLLNFDLNEDVIIAHAGPNNQTTVVTDVSTVADNNGAAQLNTSEAEALWVELFIEEAELRETKTGSAAS